MESQLAQDWIEEVWTLARASGMDPAETDFALVPGETLWAMASYGWPHAPAHWTFGRDYWRIRRQNMTGVSRLVELVVPGDPCLAYIDEASPLADQKLVVCHVAGHVDLFRRHPLFQESLRDMPRTFWSAAERASTYADEHGAEAVEGVMDAALSLQAQVGEPPADAARDDASPDFRDLFIPKTPGPARERPSRWALPTADVLGFIAAHAPLLEPWERDLCEVVRLAGLARRATRLTKIVHEGYASWAHHHLLDAMPLSGQERIVSARSRALIGWESPAMVNPYDLGYRLFRFMEEQEGAPAVVASAPTLTDGEFLGRWLTEESVGALQLYRYHWVDAGRHWRATRDGGDWRAVRDELVDAMVEEPPHVAVEAVEPDYTLVLRWDDPAPPDEPWAKLTLDATARLWGGGVRLERERGPALIADKPVVTRRAHV